MMLHNGPDRYGYTFAQADEFGIRGNSIHSGHGVRVPLVTTTYQMLDISLKDE